MDVKDVKPIAVTPERVSIPEKSQVNSRPISQFEEPAVEVSTAAESRANEVRKSANLAINAVNVAVDATNQIDRLVKSIAGITEQASNEAVPQKRREVLATEANQLIEAIRKQANESTAGTVKPLAGDPIRLEVEKEIGRTLDVILPDDAKKAFGLDKVDFSKKDAIITTRASIERAQQQLEKLKNAVTETKSTVESTVVQLEVAFQNSEASNPSLRDLDQALRLAGKTGSGIGDNPRAAIGSLGDLNQRALELLE